MKDLLSKGGVLKIENLKLLLIELCCAHIDVWSTL